MAMMTKKHFSRAGGFKRALALQEGCNGWVVNTKVCNQLCNKSYQYYLKPSKQPMSLMTLGQVGLKKKKGGNSKARVFSTVSGFILSRGEKLITPCWKGRWWTVLHASPRVDKTLKCWFNFPSNTVTKLLNRKLLPSEGWWWWLIELMMRKSHLR